MHGHGHCRLPLLPGKRLSQEPRHSADTLPEKARKTLEDVDFLFNQDRTIWTFKDRQARRVGAIFERDMAHGEVLTNLDDKGHTQAIEEIEARRKGECRRP